MKYSFIITYYNRTSLHAALASFEHHYKGRTDYEVLILEDKKTVNDVVEHGKLMLILNRFKKTVPVINHCMTFDNYACPCSSMNYGVAIAQGKFIIITNPECFHVENVLKGLDEEFAKDQNVYVNCACINTFQIQGGLDTLKDFVFKQGPKDSWYQHSVVHNRALNFCTAISKEKYIEVMGFNELFDKGLGRADVEFVSRVRRVCKLVYRDDLLTAHIAHGKTMGRKDLINYNAGVKTFKSRFQKVLV